MAKILVRWQLSKPDDVTTAVEAQAELDGDGLYLNVYERIFSPDSQFLGGVRIHWHKGRLVADIDTEDNLHHEQDSTRLVLYDPVHRPRQDSDA